MHRTYGRILAVLAPVVFLLDYSVQAQQEDRSRRFIQRFDRNGDGRIEKNELPERMRRFFERVDANGDGFITLEEDQAFRSRFRRNRPDRRTRPRSPSVPPTHADVPYGPHPKQRFDIWTLPGPKPTPLVLFIHGGGFRGGDKRHLRPDLLDGLLAAHIAVASLNYRLTDEGPFPMQMRDCARALQYIRHHAAEYNIDPKRVGSTGGSAGAGISLWLAFHDDLADPKSEDPVARQSTRLACAAVFGAQTSYDPRFIKKLFPAINVNSAWFAFFGMKSLKDVENPDFWPMFEEASPLHHLTPDDPPVYLYYSQPNTPLPPDAPPGVYIHHPKFGFALKAKMDPLGIPCTVRSREDAPRFPVQEIVDFFRRNLLHPENAPQND